MASRWVSRANSFVYVCLPKLFLPSRQLCIRCGFEEVCVSFIQATSCVMIKEKIVRKACCELHCVWNVWHWFLSWFINRNVFVRDNGSYCICVNHFCWDGFVKCNRGCDYFEGVYVVIKALVTPSWHGGAVRSMSEEKVGGVGRRRAVCLLRCVARNERSIPAEVARRVHSDSVRLVC